MDRRRALAALGWLGGSAWLLDCKSSSQEASPDTPEGSAACAETPEETAGPYPDTMDMVANQAFYRSDVREDRNGITLTLVFTVVAADACTPISGANVEIWHCDADGVYSEYANTMNAGSTTSTFLRGVQTTDVNGQVTFTTIYPGWYQGRATHVHVQVYNGTVVKKTTQLAFPADVNELVYGGVSPYYTKGQNPTTNEADMVFGDGDTLELGTVTGSVDAGYAATLQVAVASY